MSDSPDFLPAADESQTDSWWQYTQKLLTGMAFGVIILLTIALGNYVWQSYQSIANHARDRRFHTELYSILVQIQHAREMPSPDFNLVREKAEILGATIKKVLDFGRIEDIPARRALLSIAEHDLPQLIQDDLATVSEAENTIAFRLLNLAGMLDLPPPSFNQDPHFVAALAEIERLGGVITRDWRLPIQPVTRIQMKGNQFQDVHLDCLPDVAYFEIDSSEITDAGLQKLLRIRRLKNVPPALWKCH